MVDDTRTRLVESALRLLREEGLDAVTLRAVGDLAGLSRTAPYRHFADKTALLAALAVRVLADLTAHIAGAIGEGAGPRDRLRAFYLSYVEYAAAHPEEYRLVFASEFLAGSHPELETAIDQVMTALGLGGPWEGPAHKARVMALLATAHGLAELAVAGQFAHKGLMYEDIVDVLVAPDDER
ncbi:MULTISPECIES: TetR/AcrR family transcriptional regulator [unclassified Streptosporangium]|uniref:TetR/AcrR family transcriptional regulator n=1 Tax=unclassified Streptosporangium TaxID=2632669 RepID=UPI002E2D85ED|nr:MULTISPECIES: TetR/AcrR family transcriptional regulator [unclassified Streptosporangium]